MAKAKKKAAKKATKKASRKGAKKAAKKAAKKSAKKSAKKKAGQRGAWLEGIPVELDGATKLVIVESPAKAKTINKYLGKDYKVVASMGHVRDLPKNRFGIDIENEFEPRYVEINRKKKHTRELRKAAKQVDEVWLCPDPDREGEAIAWHLTEALRVPEEKVRRVTFSEITERAVTEAFKNPRDINLDLVEAQQARRILDRVVGYKLSPLLWKKVIKRLSAGRVQSVAVRIICEREDEIEAFVPEEYWKITARLAASNGRTIAFNTEFRGRIRERREQEVCPVCEGGVREMNTPRGKILRCADTADCTGSLRIAGDGSIVEAVKVTNEAESKAIMAELEGKPFVVADVTKRETRGKPAAPFSTSTLQQAAASRLRFTARKTMMLAQRLYEGVEMGAEGSVALITYMRTDSFNIAAEALGNARDYIGKTFSKEYLPKEPNVYKSRKGAQEAHEAVRPTQVSLTPESVAKHLEPDMLKLYRLVWERFIACQMMPALFDDTSATILAGDLVFPAHGRVLTFPGCQAVYGPMAKDEKDQKKLPPLEEGKELKMRKITPTQHFTSPPSRYSEASLVRTLEREGIGRPSTYAAIISTIQMRGYVQKIGSSFKATELGRIVNKKLLRFFPSVMNISFTAEMETKLDGVGDGTQDWVKILQDFYKKFSKQLERAEEKMPAEVEKESPGGETCDVCERRLIVKLSRKGRFLGCPGFPDCRYSRPLGPDGKALPIPEDARGVDCPNCGLRMVLRVSRRGLFLACPGFPTCRTTIPLDENGKLVVLESTDEVCEKCGSPMQVRLGRYGKFLSCTGYPRCRNAKPLPGTLPGESLEGIEGVDPCEKCGEQMVLRRTKKGGYLLCAKAPECKVKRAIDDIVRESLAKAGKPLPGDEEMVGAAAGGEADESTGDAVDQ